MPPNCFLMEILHWSCVVGVWKIVNFSQERRITNSVLVRFLSLGVLIPGLIWTCNPITLCIIPWWQYTRRTILNRFQKLYNASNECFLSRVWSREFLQIQQSIDCGMSVRDVRTGRVSGRRVAEYFLKRQYEYFCNKFTTLRLTLVPLVLVRQQLCVFHSRRHSGPSCTQVGPWSSSRLNSTVGTWTADDNKTIGRIVKPSAVTGVSRGHWPVTQLFSGLAGSLALLSPQRYTTTLLTPALSLDTSSAV